MEPEVNFGGSFEELSFSYRKEDIRSNILNGNLPKLNSPDVVDAIARFWGCSNLQAKNGLEITIESITDLTILSKNFVISGFGGWDLRPKMKEPGVPLDESKIKAPLTRIKFSTSKILHESVNSYYQKDLAPIPVGLNKIMVGSNTDIFSYTFPIHASDKDLISKVQSRGKAGSEDLYSMMVAKGIPTKGAARNLFWSIAEVISERLSIGQPVYIAGLGKFETRLAESRMVRNPQTGEMMKTADLLRIAFQPSSLFKTKVAAAYSSTD
jgi:nucleoid DNA-binding protein